jgi:hypothetical protein
MESAFGAFGAGTCTGFVGYQHDAQCMTALRFWPHFFGVLSVLDLPYGTVNHRVLLGMCCRLLKRQPKSLTCDQHGVSCQKDG